jgi:hypothetical protein
MRSVPPLLTFLLMVVSGWVHRQQLIVIEFLQAENRLLKGASAACESDLLMPSGPSWPGRQRQ